jgi:nickel-dependent lactate racemase
LKRAPIIPIVFVTATLPDGKPMDRPKTSTPPAVQGNPLTSRPRNPGSPLRAEAASPDGQVLPRVVAQDLSCVGVWAESAAPEGQILSEVEIRQVLLRALEGRFSRQKLLVLIPDHTRTFPLPFLFRVLLEALRDARALDFLVALGTHPPLSDDQFHTLLGITSQERAFLEAGRGVNGIPGSCPPVHLLNHAWDDPSALVSLGRLERDELRALAGPFWHPSLPDQVEVRLNRAALQCDHILIVGPTFPHEVVGFSGGAKYLFPGISGPEVIHATHWLGALIGVVNVIGIADTPVRQAIHAAARRLPTPVTLVAAVMDGCDLAGLFIGDLHMAWECSVVLSAKRHIRWHERPFRKVLSHVPPMYDELWTAAKAMYKVEPVVEEDGEVIIYAPHLETVSRVHGRYIYEVGYHTLPYFLAHWDRYRHIPLGVLAHSTHLRGMGRMENGVEKPRVRVILASRIPPDDCRQLNLEYMDPASVRVEEWQGREAEGILYVPRAGEILHRLR